MEDGKEIIELSKNIFISRPKDFSGIVPLFCPVCSFPMRTSEDSASYRKSKCCKECEKQFVENDKLNPPNEDSPEWINYIKYRNDNSKVKINLK